MIYILNSTVWQTTRFKIGKQKLSATAAGVAILNAQDSGGKVSGLHTG